MIKNINNIRTIISKGKLKKAIDLLWSKIVNEKYKDNIVSIRQRFSSYQNKVINGLLSTQDSTLQENQISYSLLELLNKIETESKIKPLDQLSQKSDANFLAKKLLEILDESYKGFISQSELRNKLVSIIQKRLSLNESLEYEAFFEKYYAKMDDTELAYHNSIRDFTREILNKYNRKALELIIGNRSLETAIPRLMELERHLLVWLGKYEQIFERTPSLSILYVGVEENVPFPRGIEEELRKYLARNK